jgi:hypothetical protein
MIETIISNTIAPKRNSFFVSYLYHNDGTHSNFLVVPNVLRLYCVVAVIIFIIVEQELNWRRYETHALVTYMRIRNRTFSYVECHKKDTTDEFVTVLERPPLVFGVILNLGTVGLACLLSCSSTLWSDHFTRLSSTVPISPPNSDKISGMHRRNDSA